MNKLLNNLWREASALELLRAPWRHFAAIYNPSADRWQLGGWTPPQKHAQLNRYDNDQSGSHGSHWNHQPAICCNRGVFQTLSLDSNATNWRQVDGWWRNVPSDNGDNGGTPSFTSWISFPEAAGLSGCLFANPTLSRSHKLPSSLSFLSVHPPEANDIIMRKSGAWLWLWWWVLLINIIIIYHSDWQYLWLLLLYCYCCAYYYHHYY